MHQSAQELDPPLINHLYVPVTFLVHIPEAHDCTHIQEQLSSKLVSVLFQYLYSFNISVLFQYFKCKLCIEQETFAT